MNAINASLSFVANQAELDKMVAERVAPVITENTAATRIEMLRACNRNQAELIERQRTQIADLEAWKKGMMDVEDYYGLKGQLTTITKERDAYAFAILAALGGIIPTPQEGYVKHGGPALAEADLRRMRKLLLETSKEQAEARTERDVLKKSVDLLRAATIVVNGWSCYCSKEVAGFCSVLEKERDEARCERDALRAELGHRSVSERLKRAESEGKHLAEEGQRLRDCLANLTKHFGSCKTCEGYSANYGCELIPHCFECDSTGVSFAILKAAHALFRKLDLIHNSPEEQVFWRHVVSHGITVPRVDCIDELATLRAALEGLGRDSGIAGDIPKKAPGYLEWVEKDGLWRGSLKGYPETTLFVIERIAEGLPHMRLLGAFIPDEEERLPRSMESAKENAEEWLSHWINNVIPPFSKGIASAFQTWVTSLSVMQQSVLFAAVRGPDGIRKDHPVKVLCRWYRRSILISAFDRRALVDPYEPGGGSFTGPCRSDEVRDLDHAVDLYLRTVDELPHHFQLHFMHAAEILGYKHPLSSIRQWWHAFYLRVVNDAHLFPETEEQMDQRLGDTEAGWRAREEVVANGSGACAVKCEEKEGK